MSSVDVHCPNRSRLFALLFPAESDSLPCFQASRTPPSPGHMAGLVRSLPQRRAMPHSTDPATPAEGAGKSFGDLRRSAELFPSEHPQRFPPRNLRAHKKRVFIQILVFRCTQTVDAAHGCEVRKKTSCCSFMLLLCQPYPVPTSTWSFDVEGSHPDSPRVRNETSQWVLVGPPGGV